MRRWFLLLFLLLGLVFPTAAQAQTTLPVEIANLEVDIWPEYDRPDVLVIYRVTLSPQTRLPADLTLRVPASIGKPYNVAIKDVDGQLYDLAYTANPVGEWLELRFSTPALEMQIEYYDPGLVRKAASRSFEYRWAADYDVRSLTVQILQPVGANNMNIVPSLGSGRTEPNGLTYFTAVLGEVKAGTPLAIRIGYDKVDDTLTADFQQVQAAPINQATTGRTTLQELLPWGLGLLGVLLIVGGGLWYRQASQPEAKRLRRRRAVHAPEETAAAADTVESAVVYCHQCGRRTAPADVFCRGCGTRLRVG